MKESYWGYWLVLLGIFIIVVMMLTQDATTISSQDYYQLKEVANAAVLDSIDYNYYAETYDIRMHKELFVANFMKRFAQSVDMTNTYRIDFVDLYESPPKVSIKISTKSNSFNIAGAGDITDLDVTNTIDLIVQYGSGGPGEKGDKNTTVIDGCTYYGVTVGSVPSGDKTLGGGSTGGSGSSTDPGSTSTVSATAWEESMFPLGNPAAFRVTSKFGYRGYVCSGCSTWHKAMDFGAAVGTPVYAVLDGTVTKAYKSCAQGGGYGCNGGAGNFVEIDHHNGYKSRYLHSSNVVVNVGQEVKKGDLIMYVGSTGVGTGPHLDFRIIGYDGLYYNPSYLVPSITSTYGTIGDAASHA